MWLLQVPDQNERVKGMETGWSDDQPWPSKAHGFPYMVYGLDLQMSQLPCHSPHLKSADYPGPSGVQICKFKGVCHAQIISNYVDSLQTHGNSWKFPSTLTAVESGRGILFPWFGVLFRSKCDKLSEYFYRGLIRSMELTIGLHQQGCR